jgi:tetratricopeptide (TPR) repeat protein
MMKQGNYQRALALFAGVWKKVPGHPGVGQNFPTALEGLKKSGDETYQQGRFEDAGMRWTAAMRYLSHPALKGRSIAFSRRDVKGNIDKLSAFLMEKGLSEYRQGGLQEAIVTWRQILAYDPDHEEATKSVKTATTQLENLKKITPPAGGK